MLCRVMFIAALTAVGSGVARGDDAASRTAGWLQGEWVGAEIEVNGEKGSEEDAKAFRIAVKGDMMTLMTCKGSRCIERKKTFKLDCARAPMEIDLTALDGQEKGTTQPCIFSVDKDQLRLCAPLFSKDSGKRPTEFKTRSGDGLMVVVLRRVGSK